MSPGKWKSKSRGADRDEHVKAVAPVKAVSDASPSDTGSSELPAVPDVQHESQPAPSDDEPRPDYVFGMEDSSGVGPTGVFPHAADFHEESVTHEEMTAAANGSSAGSAIDTPSLESGPVERSVRDVIAVVGPVGEQPTSGARPYRSYGERSVLTPIPVTVQASAGDPFHTPVDTELQWVDQRGLAVRGVSTRGHSHRYAGEVRQDAMALGDAGGFTWLAVADGVGSREHSHIGARLATSLAVASRELLVQAQQAMGESDALTRVTISSLAAEMEAYAIAHGLPSVDLACTLVVAAVRPPDSSDPESKTRAVLWQLGDSCFGRISSDELTLLTKTSSSDDLINTSTEALPLDLGATRWVVDLEVGETLALMTDGVSNIVQPVAGFRQDLAALWSEGPPSPADLLSVVDASVKSFDDDRTFLGVRVQ